LQAIGALEDTLAQRHANTHTFFTMTVYHKKTGEVCDIDFVLLENETAEKDSPSPRASFAAFHEMVPSL
jgi:hypothetical protein